MPNVTMSMDEELLKAGREFAASEGTSLNALLRKLLQTAISSQRLREESRVRLVKLMDTSTGRLPSDYKFNREQIYESPSLSRFQRARLRSGGKANQSD